MRSQRSTSEGTSARGPSAARYSRRGAAARTASRHPLCLLRAIEGDHQQRDVSRGAHVERAPFRHKVARRRPCYPADLARLLTTWRPALRAPDQALLVPSYVRLDLMRTGSFRPGGGSVDGSREFAVSETFSGLDGDGGWVGGPGLVGSLWRYRLVIVAVTALAAIAGYAVSLLLPAKCDVQASVFLRDPGSPAVLTLGSAKSSRRGPGSALVRVGQPRRADLLMGVGRPGPEDPDRDTGRHHLQIRRNDRPAELPTCAATARARYRWQSWSPSPDNVDASRNPSKPPRAALGWTNTRSAAGPPGTAGPPWPCSPMPSWPWPPPPSVTTGPPD